MNTLPFLRERFETIFAQTFKDWELLIYDSFSDDGAWEYISDLAEKDPRIRAWQGPREGTPGSWSPCVKEARGDYVYIATSDDTMPPECLERLVGALESHPECDLAHCTLHAVDENGKEDPINNWWSRDSLFSRSSGELINQPHVRMAPFDGLLHLVGETVYISITQLLIRRSLFEKVGLFESRWGAPGDFAWNMRASLVANTIHVPDTWGGLRLHSSQATDAATHASAQHQQKVDGMIESAISDCKKFLDEPVRRKLDSSWAKLARDFREFYREIDRRTDPLDRRSFVARKLLTGSAPARIHFKSKLSGKTVWPETGPALVRNWLEEAGMGPVLVPVKEGQESL